MGAIAGCDPKDAEPDTGPTIIIEPPCWPSGCDTSPPQLRFYAVSLDDRDQFLDHRTDGASPCATSATKAHGADIDAVELIDNDGTSLGFLTQTLYADGGVCPDTAFVDPEEAEGPPDPATPTSGFVSLAGGTLAGEFDPAVLEILEGYTIVVYEVGDDEGYSVWVMSDIGCTPRSNVADCRVVLISDASVGSDTIAMPAL